MIKNLIKEKNIIAAMSERSDGEMKFSKNLMLQNDIEQNRKKFFSSLNIKPAQVVSADLIHGNTITKISKADGGKIIKETDGLITNSKNIFLTVTVADCLPIFFYDPITKAVGIVHAGWQGLYKKIIVSAVRSLCDTFGCSAEHIIASVGPAIGFCHYEIQKDRAEKFSEFSASTVHRDGKIFLNLPFVANQQLQSVGIKQQNIFISDECTYCNNEKFFSFRRDQPDHVQAMIAIIGITS